MEFEKHRVLSDEEVRNLMDRIKENDKVSFDKLVEANLGLVRKVVWEVRRNSSLYEKDDLFQQGVIGLMRAIDSYDYEKAQFSTYAYYWIKQSIGRYMKSNSTTLKVPEYLGRDYNLYKKYIAKYKEEFNRLPSEEDIKTDLGFSSDRLRTILEYENYTAVSLNQSVGEDTALEYFVGEEDLDYAAIDNREELNSYLRVFKRYLKPGEYFVFYHIEIKGTKVGKLANDIGCSSQLISLYLKNAKSKLKDLFNNEALFNKINRLVNKDGSVEVGSIDDYVKYFLIKDHLDEFEKRVYISLYLEKDNSNLFDRRMFKKAFKKIERLLKDLEENYLERKRKVIAEQKMKIFIVPKAEIPKDYRRLFERFEMLSLEDFRKLDSDFYEELNSREKELVKAYLSLDKSCFSERELIIAQRKINLYLLGYYQRRVNIPLRLLKKTYLLHRDEFSKENQDILDNLVFGNKKSYLSRKELNAVRMQSEALVRQLERIYLGIRGKVNAFLTSEMVKDVLKNNSNKLNERERYILNKYFLDEKSLIEISKEMSIPFETASGYLTNACDKATKLYLGRKTRSGKDLSVYKDLLLNSQIEIESSFYEILYLRIIGGLDNKEVSERLNLDIKEVANKFLIGLKKLDFIRYGLDGNNKVLANKEELKSFFNGDSLEEQIIKARFIDNRPLEEIARRFDLEIEKIRKILHNAKDIILKQIMKTTEVTEEDIYCELNCCIQDSLFTEEELKMLSRFYGLACQYNPLGEEMASEEKKRVCRVVDRMRKNIKLKKLGVLSKIEGFISYEDANNLLNNARVPLLDEDRKILIDLKLNGLTRKEIIKKYHLATGALSRKISSGVLTLLKFQAGEIEEQLIYETDVLPYLKYFCVFDKEVLILKYGDGLSAPEIGKRMGLNRDQVFEVLDRVENELRLILKKDKQAVHFDFDYARTVLYNDDLPFRGNLKVARKLYEYVWGEIDGKRHNYVEAIKFWSINLDARRASEYVIDLMIAIGKYKIGIKKQHSFGYQDVVEVYQELKRRSMTSQDESYFKNYFQNVQNGGDETKICDWIIYEILKSKGMLVFEFGMDKEKVKPLLQRISMINRETYKIVMKYYGFSERELLSGKEINRVLRIFDRLACKLDKKMGYELGYKI